MHTAIRVDASSAIGIGHFMRCRRLAVALRARGASVRFVTRHLPPALAEGLAADRFEHSALTPADVPGGAATYREWLGVDPADDARETAEALRDRTWDWIVVDQYALDAAWERALRVRAKQVLAIDDLADRAHDCDVLLDQNLYRDAAARYDGKVPATCVRLLGPAFALLDDAFAGARARVSVRRGPVERMLVCFGGSDSADYTARALDAVAQSRTPPRHVDVVIGRAHPDREGIERQCREYGYTLHVQSDRLAELTAAADLGIGAGGSMTWERCALGLPAIVFAMADNQRQVVRDGAASGILYAPDVDGHLADLMRRHLDALVGNSALRTLISEAGMRAVDGRGVARVVRAMGVRAVTVREAAPDDTRAVFEWRNAPAVRAMSHGEQVIAWPAHERWFHAALASADRDILIGERDGQGAGVVRFDVDGAAAEVSIYLSPGPHPAGTGIELLQAAEAWVAAARPAVATLRASVRAHNHRSHRLFTAAGYQPDATMYVKPLSRG